MTTIVLLIALSGGATPGGSCLGDIDCTSGATCVGTFCRKTCSATEACVAGQRCLKVEDDFAFCVDDQGANAAPQANAPTAPPVNLAPAPPPAPVLPSIGSEMPERWRQGVSDKAYAAAWTLTGAFSLATAALVGVVDLSTSDDPSMQSTKSFLGTYAVISALIGIAEVSIGYVYSSAGDEKLSREAVTTAPPPARGSEGPRVHPR